MAEAPPTSTVPIQPGRLHTYAPGLVAFEHDFDSSLPKPHSLIFVGGLFDGMFTVPYLPTLALSVAQLGYTLFSIILSSSYAGFGMSSLGKDVEQIGLCVDYVRKYKREASGNSSSKVVLMGHSTGSQDVLHYLIAPNPLQTPAGPGPKLKGLLRLPVEGAVMQAPASDREGVQVAPEDLEKYKRLAELSNAAAPGTEELLPLSATKPFFGNTPMSARRFVSLLSPLGPGNPGEDDYFSSDFTDDRLARTFGSIGQSRLLTSNSLLAIMSGGDEHVPKTIDKNSLLKRWTTACGNGGISLTSEVIPGASHAMGGADQQQQREDLVRCVMGYLSGTSPKL